MKRHTQPQQPHVEKDSTFFESQVNDFNLLLLTVTSVEKAALHNVMQPLPGQTGLVKIHKGTQTYYLGMFGSYYAVHVNCDNMGSANLQASQATTTDAIHYCSPKAIVMMGIAMGASLKNKIGDVLISETIVHYEPQRVGAEETISRAKTGTANITLVNRFKEVSNWNHKINKRGPARIPGEILSGEKLVDNADFKKELLTDYPNAKGLEMEGFGVHVAATSKNVPWIVVKAICDYGDGEKKVKKEQRQRVAAISSTNLCLHVFRSAHAFKDIGLIAIAISSEELSPPVEASVQVPDGIKIELEILQEMVNEENDIPADLTANLKEMVRAFLSLNDVEKANIVRDLNMEEESLNNLEPHLRDRQFFALAKQRQLLPNVWEAVNKVSNFKSQTNPFKPTEK